jgi:molybdopterin molybdotransferase
VHVIADKHPSLFRDVRLEGFANRIPLEEAILWIDRHSQPLASEEVPTERAASRVLASPFAAPRDIPPADTAVIDGYALRSGETIGAGSYNPLPFSLQTDTRVLAPSSALLLSAGTALPQGADAVASFDLVRTEKSSIEAIAPVTPGAGVYPKGQEAQQGTTLLDNSRPLRPSDAGLLASLGVKTVEVMRQPRVRLILAGYRSTPEEEMGDADGPMLRALIARDGGVLESSTYGVREQSSLTELIARPGADVVLVCGLTGTGPDDVAPLALNNAGTLSVHGIALRPGSSAGMGTAGGATVLLLPGNPLHCLCAYDLFAGRLIRRLGGRSSQLPYRVRHIVVGRKIVSSIGNDELCQIRLVSDKAIPLGAAESGGLVFAARADGFVMIPAPLEGYPPGATVSIYMYDEPGDREGKSK